jgi:hypothetical protein
VREEGSVTASQTEGRTPQAESRSLAGLTLQGFALFLFIPLVLFLFLRQPIGPGWSVAVGLAIMLGHRLIAEPWAAKFADVRCLWCGRVGPSIAFPVVSGGRTWSMNACSDEHLEKVTRFLNLLHAGRSVFRTGIAAPLGILLVISLATALGRVHGDIASAALFFRVVVAVTVLCAATIPFVIRPRSAGMPLRSPFPIHNLFLLGMRNTLWIFRIVGTWWIADAVWRAIG